MNIFFLSRFFLLSILLLWCKKKHNVTEKQVSAAADAVDSFFETIHFYLIRFVIKQTHVYTPVPFGGNESFMRAKSKVARNMFRIKLIALDTFCLANDDRLLTF